MAKPNPNPGRAYNVEAKFFHEATKEHAATLTKQAMKATFNALSKCAEKGRWGNVTPETITQKQLSKYVQQRVAEGLEPRTVKNQVAHIRRSIRLCGRIEFERSFSNQDLGVPKATYIGTGKVTDPLVLEKALERASPIERAWINAMNELGLRERELVRAGPSLQQWERQIVSGQPIYLYAGAKTGRSRQVFIAPERREAALETVRALKEVADRQGGHVVARETLEKACKHVSYRLATLGLKGENSPHSLRRDFAVNQINHYRREGFSEVEARCRISVDLGHGDSRQRGTVAFNNYVRTSEQAAA
jgi:integrase